MEKLGLGSFLGLNVVDIEAAGGKVWLVDGERHRIDGPAVERPDGTKEWWISDERHREDGPAVESPNRGNEWYINGKECDKDDLFCNKILHKDYDESIDIVNALEELDALDEVQLEIYQENLEIVKKYEGTTRLRRL